MMLRASGITLVVSTCISLYMLYLLYMGLNDRIEFLIAQQVVQLVSFVSLLVYVNLLFREYNKDDK